MGMVRGAVYTEEVSNVHNHSLNGSRKTVDGEDLGDIRGFYKYSFVKAYETDDVLLRLKRTSISKYDVLNITRRSAVDRVPKEPEIEYTYGDKNEETGKKMAS